MRLYMISEHAHAQCYYQLLIQRTDVLTDVRLPKINPDGGWLSTLTLDAQRQASHPPLIHLAVPLIDVVPFFDQLLCQVLHVPVTLVEVGVPSDPALHPLYPPK